MIAARRMLLEGTKKIRSFLEYTDNFLEKITTELMNGIALLNLIFANKEEIVRDVKAAGSLTCSIQEMVEFRVLRGRNKAKSRITATDFRKVDFGIFRVLLGEIPWEMTPGRTGVQENQLIFMDHLLHARSTLMISKTRKGVWRPAWMKKELLARIRHKKEVFKCRSKERLPGRNTEMLPEHVRFRNASPYTFESDNRGQ